jgi:hypothetical protein
MKDILQQISVNNKISSRRGDSQQENNESYLIALRKFSNISRISASHSRSNITTHDLTLATVSRIEVLFVYDRLELSDRFSNEDTIN